MRWLVRRETAGDAGAVRAVLDAAARRAAAGGERLVVVLGHPGYYPRFGFAGASALGVGVAFEAADGALMALVLDGPGPVPSGTVAYPAPFGPRGHPLKGRPPRGHRRRYRPRHRPRCR